MAYHVKKTEHAGPKKGRGGYAGRKADAKRESSKLRRRRNAQEIDLATNAAIYLDGLWE